MLSIAMYFSFATVRFSFYWMVDRNELITTNLDIHNLYPFSYLFHRLEKYGIEYQIMSLCHGMPDWP